MEATTTTRPAAPAAPTAYEPAPLVPPVDIVEDAEGITLKADLPGVAREDLSVDIDGDSLTIEGEVKLGEPARMQPLYAEVRVARYRRAFVLGPDLDSDNVEASIRNGVLTLRLPKREAAKPRRIAVRAD